MSFYYNSKRDREPKVLVPLTLKEAEMAVEALRHVGRQVFEDQPGEQVLCDASTAVADAIASTPRA